MKNSLAVTVKMKNYDNRDFIKEVVVLYIDLRKYTDMVDSKNLINVIEIVDGYQKLVTEKIKSEFTETDIITIEYMGDGIIVILANPYYDKTIPKSLIKCINLAIELKRSIKSYLKNMKMQYSMMEKVDFGIGISQGEMYIKLGTEKNSYIGAALNHAVKIGDVQDQTKHNIGIEQHVFEQLGIVDNIKRVLKSTNLEKVPYIMLDDLLSNQLQTLCQNKFDQEFKLLE